MITTPHYFPKRKEDDKLLPLLLTYLVDIIKRQRMIILALMKLVILLTRNSRMPQLTAPDNLNYQKLKIDELPLIEKVDKLDYRLLLQTHFEKTGKVLQPIQRRKGVKINLDLNTTCPRCNAPSDYLYANNGSKGQCNCKVCDALFNPKNRYSKEAILKCPHCSHPLEKIKDRNGFDVYKCKRADCPYYLRRLKELTPEEKDLFEKDSQQFKMHYLFRQFNIPFNPISKDSVIQPKVNLANIHCSPYTLGLILTYHVNYGLSARKTAALMYDVHNVRISGQTILNYASSTSVVLKPFLENYPYELSDQFCGDETYIRVGGRWNYLFFFFDAVKKIILSNYVSPNRDTESAIYALREVFKKMPQIPEDLTFIVDGNPIYLLAQHYYAQHGIPFDVKQVIGLTNNDPVSKEYRPLKQIIERLNRTFKGNYRATTGFGSQQGSVSFVTLFCVYFNFLRPHAALEKKVPVLIPELDKLPNMPAKWTKLISLSQEWLMDQTP